MRIYVVRHGQTDSNLHRISQKNANPPINATGTAQCKHCSVVSNRSLNGGVIDAVYYSPSLRTTQTMELIMQGRPTPKIHESSGQIAQGCTKGDVETFVERTMATIKQSKLENVSIVSHGPVIKYMFQWLFNTGALQPFQKAHTPRNAAIAEIEYAGGTQRSSGLDITE